MNDMLLDMSFNPQVRGLFRGGDQKVYGRNGTLAAYALAIKLDMAAATDPSVVDEIYTDVEGEATELTVAGHRVVRVDYGDGFYYAAVKRDVLLIVVGDSAAALEPVLAKLLANIR